MQGHFFSSDTAPEVILQKSFAEELLGKRPKPGVDETKVAELAAPLLGKELTMRYAQRETSERSAADASASRALLRQFGRTAKLWRRVLLRGFARASS